MPKKVFLFGSYNAFSFQPETTAYLNALAVPNDSTVYFSGLSQQILGSVVWTKIDAFVITLKNAYGLTLGLNNLSTKVPAIYPFWGGTATMTKFNLVDAQDLNSAHRILWNGGVTHSQTGVAFNGSNAYGDTNLTPRTKFGTNYYGFVYAINSYSSNVVFGGRDGGSSTDYEWSAANLASLNNAAVSIVGPSIGVSALYRDNSTQYKYKINGAIQTINSAYINSLTVNEYIGALNNGSFGGTILYSNANLKTFCIISQPTDANITTLQNAITQLNLDLNR